MDKIIYTIEYIGSSPFNLILEFNNFKRTVGFYRMKELELLEDFVKDHIKSFKNTVKNLQTPPEITTI